MTQFLHIPMCIDQENNRDNIRFQRFLTAQETCLFDCAEIY